MSPYRTPAPAPARPALTLWQRALVTTLGARRCARWQWFRAHVGGRWARLFTGWERMPACPARWIPQWSGYIRSFRVYREASDLVEEHRRACTCEVYPLDAASAGQLAPPQRAPGWHVVSRPGAVLHVEEHVLTAEERAALNIGRRGLR